VNHKGTLITGLIVAGVAAILLLNLEPGKSPSSAPSRPVPVDAVAGPQAAVIREHPIGDEIVANHIRVAAVWLSAVAMDGMSAAGPNPIHIEADVKATEDNPNGYAKDDPVAYLKIAYAIVPGSGGAPIASGELVPMMARDGFHYGATVAMPPVGDYHLVYDLQPPSANGLGRHSDPSTGVAPWWEPFRASFDWTVEPEDTAPALAGTR